MIKKENIALWLSGVALVGTLGLGSYSYHLYQSLEDLLVQRQEMENAMNALVKESKASVAQAEKWHAQQTHHWQALKKELQTDKTQLFALTGEKDWVLSEVNYLVSIAYERLHFEKDIPSAIAALKASEKKIKALGDPSLNEIREAFAKDILSLENVATLDKQALWVKLNSISTQYPQLQFKTMDTLSAKEEKKSYPKEKMPDWQKIAWQSWQEMKSLVQVTRLDQNKIPEVLTAQEKMQVLLILQSHTEQAQWAVFHQNTQILTDSLEQIIHTIQVYFMQDKLAMTLIEQLKAIEQQTLNYTIPDISASLHALSKEKEINQRGNQ